MLYTERELDMIARARAECCIWLLGSVCDIKSCEKCQRGINLDYLYARRSTIDQIYIDVQMKKYLRTADIDAINYRFLKPQNIDFNDAKSIKKYVYRPIKLFLFFILFITTTCIDIMQFHKSCY